jgi:hypothetical protein
MCRGRCTVRRRECVQRYHLVGDGGEYRAEREPVRGGGDGYSARASAIDCDDTSAVSDEFRGVRGFSSRRGADIENPHAVLGFE